MDESKIKDEAYGAFGAVRGWIAAHPGGALWVFVAALILTNLATCAMGG